MYMRLWWKDARQFWPIWAFLVVAAGGVQLLMYEFAGERERANMLVPMAMGWTCLYAFAAGAAAFAGERESGTLRMLDTLPARREVVWLGKASFAVASTIGLGAVLVALAATGAVPNPGAPWGVSDRQAMTVLGLMVFDALAWGLFFSSILPSALISAVAAIGATTILRLLNLDDWFRTPNDLPTWELAVSSGAILASLVSFAWVRRDRGPALGLPFAMRLRSPIEVSWTRRPRASAGKPRAAFADAADVTAAIRPAIAASAGAVDRPRPRSRFAEYRSLVRQTMREGRGTWWTLAAIGLVPTGLAALGTQVHAVEPLALLIWDAIIALVAGVSVFGLEGHRRTQRFLVHHGARPGLIWLAKVSAWAFGLAVIWGPQVFFLAQDSALVHQVDRPHVPAVFLSLPTWFAVAMLCGMAIPRGITAGVIAMVAALALTFAHVGLSMVGMIPPWGGLVLPAALVALTLAWSGDWLLDRPAPGRWVRLGGLLSTVLAATFGGYTGWRAWSVEDVGPIPIPSDWVAASAPLPAELNAADLYRKAARELGFSRNPYFVRAAAAADLAESPDAMAAIRAATERPECQFFPPGRLTWRSWQEAPPMDKLAEAVAARVRHRLAHPDAKAGREAGLRAAWDEILLIFRMARQVNQGATLEQALEALSIERQGLGLAFDEWANDPGQTPDRLRAAIASYRALPAMSPPPEIVRAEGLMAERCLDLPLDDLRDLLLSDRPEARLPSTAEMLRVDLIATPWERARARRINRLLTAEFARLAAMEPRQRPRWTIEDGSSRGPVSWTKRVGIESPDGPGAAVFARFHQEARYSLAGLLHLHFGPYLRVEDRNEVSRRALVVLLGLREWQLRHDGRFPERLQELVPDVLPTLPTDPYSGRPFGYMGLEQAKQLHPSDRALIRCPEGSRLLYSIGPDRSDDHGLFMQGAPLDRYGDIVYPVPPATAGEEGR